MSTEVASLVARLRADASGYVSGIAEAVSANTRLTESSRAAATATATHAQQIGSTLSRYVSLPLAVAGGASIKMSMDFEKSFGLIKGLAGVPAGEIEGLKKSVLSLSGEVGQSPQKLAKALYFITSGGIDSAHSMDVLRASAKAATAGLGDVDTVAYSVVSAMNAFKDQHLSAAHATDVMVGTIKTATFEADQLAGAWGRVFPVADQLGVSVDEVGTALSVLSQGGLDANLSTTGLLNVFNQVIKASPEATKVWNDMFHSVEGVSKAQKLLKDGGIVEFLKKIADETKGDPTKLAALFPDIRGDVAVSSLTKAFENDPKKFRAIADDIAKSTGATDKAFRAIEDTLSGQFGRALAQGAAAMIKMGDAFAPVLGVIAKGLGVITAVAEHTPKPFLILIGTFAALLAAAGPVLVVGGALAKAWLNIGEVMATHAAKVAANQTLEAAASAQRLTQIATETGALHLEAEAAGEVTAARATSAGLGIPGVTAGAVPVAQAVERATPPPVGFMGIPTATAGAATGITEMTEAELVAAPATVTLGASMSGLAASMASVIIPAAIIVGGMTIISRAWHSAGDEARATAKDVAQLHTELDGFSKLTASQQTDQIEQKMRRVRAVIHDMQIEASHVVGGPDFKPSDPFASTTDTATPVGGAKPPNFEKHKRELQDIHTWAEQFIKDQGAMAAAPFLTRLFHDAAKVPGALGLVESVLGDVKRKADAADAASKASAANLGGAYGVGAGRAARAIAEFDRSIANATGITTEMINTGRAAAVMLSSIGVSGQYAGQAVKEGMSVAAAAVAGLLAQEAAVAESQSSYLGVLDSIQALSDAQSGTGGGGGGGGGQTASAAALDQMQKEIALRDAQQEVTRSTVGLQSAQLSLAQARMDYASSVEAQTTAEKNYQTVLHGVAAGSREARDAVLALAQAKNDAAGAKLDTSDARRGVEHAKNDKALFALNVREAQRRLAEDMGKGADAGGQTFAQTPKGSVVASSTTGTKASADTILRDQIALRDAQIDLAGADDSVKKAQLALSNSQIAGKTAANGLHDATKKTNEILHGYSAESKTAKDAARELESANIAVKQSFIGIVTAKDGVVDAQDAIHDSAVNLWRAQEDVAGRLTAAGGAAQTAAGHFRDVAKALLAAETQSKTYAEHEADRQADRITQPALWAAAYTHALEAIRGQLAPGSPLDKALQYAIQQMNLLLNPPTFKDLGGDLGQITGRGSFPSQTRAAGGPVIGSDPTGIHVLAHPGEYIVRQKAVEKYGMHMMEMLNRGEVELPKASVDLPKFAAGGAVGHLSPPTVQKQPPIPSEGWYHNAPGMKHPGNLDPYMRPLIWNADGSYSSYKSMSFNDGKGETVIPTAFGGALHSDKDSISHFHATHKHFGIFDTVPHADAFAELLHNKGAQYFDWFAKRHVQPPLHRVTGGAVVGGRDYWVGENGPERFRPAQNGIIIPNGQAGSGGGGGTTVIHKTIQLTVQSLDPRQAGPLVVEALRDESKKGPINGVVFHS